MTDDEFLARVRESLADDWAVERDLDILNEAHTKVLLARDELRELEAMTPATRAVQTMLDNALNVLKVAYADLEEELRGEKKA